MRRGLFLFRIFLVTRAGCGSLNLVTRAETTINEGINMSLRDVPTGCDFTFPAGTEDAGIRFTIIAPTEPGKDRVTARANIGMTFEPVSVFSGDEQVVRVRE